MTHVTKLTKSNITGTIVICNAENVIENYFRVSSSDQNNFKVFFSFEILYSFFPALPKPYLDFTDFI